MLIKVNNKFPSISENTYVAPSSTLIGDVELSPLSSVWFGAVIRADNGKIEIGERTNIQDNSVVHVTTNIFPIFFPFFMAFISIALKIKLCFPKLLSSKT